jgi:GAF domain-containing protein
MALPLTFHGNTIGVLDIQSREPNAFTEEDVAILQVAASQLAANIENARLVQRTEAQLREMRRLYGEQVTAAWAELAAPGRRLSYVYDRVDVTPADATPPQAFDRAVEQGTTVSVVEPETQGTVLATPLKVRGQVIGVLGLEQADGSREWSHEEIALIEAVSDQVAVAIDSARLFGEARIRAEEMIVLNELAQALAASLSMETILDEAYRGVSRLLRTPNFSVGIYDAERSMIDIVHDVSELEENGRITAIPVDQGLEGYVVRHRTSVLIGEDLIGQMERMGIEPVGPQALSWLGVPLLTGDQVLGVMTIQSHTRTNAYDEHDRRLLIAIASQTAIAIQNIRLFDQVRRRAQQEHRIYEITARLRRSPDIATILQTAVNELGQALHTDRAMVRLAVKSKETETSGT